MKMADMKRVKRIEGVTIRMKRCAMLTALAAAGMVSTIALSGLSAAAAAPTAGLLLYASFDAGVDTADGLKGDLTAITGVPRKSSRGAIDAPLVPGAKKKALDMTKNTPQLVYAAAGRISQEAGTISIWVKTTWDYDANHNGPSRVIAWWGKDPWKDEIRAFVWNNYSVAIRPSTAGQAVAADGFLMDKWAADEWHHLAFTWDGVTGEMRVFADGKSVSSGAGYVPFKVAAPKLYIGSFPSGVNDPLGAAIDELRIYDRALDDPEIEELFNEGEV
jgi:hypothetical protein